MATIGQPNKTEQVTDGAETVKQEAILQLQSVEQLQKDEQIQLEQTRMRLRQTQLLFGVVTIIIVTAVGWYLFESENLKRKYQFMIDQIDPLVENAQYDGPNGLQTAWAYEYGQIGSFFSGFVNSKLPVAIVFAFYDANLYPIFQQDVAKNLNDLKIASEAFADKSALQLLCDVLDPTHTTLSCQSDCNMVGAQTTAGQYAQILGATASASTTGLMTVMAAQNLDQFIPGASIAMGAAVVAATAFFTARSMSQQKKACEASLKNCINVTGLKCIE